MEIQLLRNDVLIKPAEIETKVGDIYIPLVAVQNATSGIVLGAGPESALQKDDEVYFLKGKWVNFTINGEDLIIVKEEHILIKLK